MALQLAGGVGTTKWSRFMKVGAPRLGEGTKNLGVHRCTPGSDSPLPVVEVDWSVRPAAWESPRVGQWKAWEGQSPVVGSTMVVICDTVLAGKPPQRACS